MDKPLEVVMKDGILSFDGRVLELFAPTLDGSTRHHVEHLAGIGLAKGLTGVKLRIRYASGIEHNFGFDEQHRAALEELVQAVWEAHG